MPSLPDNVRWYHVAVIAAAVLGGLAAAKEVKERVRLIGLLENYAAQHPQDAELSKVLIGCHKTIRIDVPGCAKKVIEKFGPDAIPRIAQMQQAGAFGAPLRPAGS